MNAPTPLPDDAYAIVKPAGIESINKDNFERLIRIRIK